MSAPLGVVAGPADEEPDSARHVFDRLGEVNPAGRDRVDADPVLRHTLAAIAHASSWLTRLCLADPAALDVLAGIDTPPGPGAPPGPPGPDAPPGPDDPPGLASNATNALVRHKRLGLLRIAARDLTGRSDLEEVVADLSDLADDLVARAVATTDGADELAVIALGKLGGRELNYASDIDLVLVAGSSDAPRSPAGHEAARGLLRALRPAWRVDLDLRPEGRAGAVVRSLPSYVAYWDRWADPWEFQALLKARAAGGDAQLGDHFVEEAAERVWNRPLGVDELRSLRATKERAEAEMARRGMAERELKRGRGGIRDIEFAVQLLQLVHGRADDTLRAPATLPALADLAAGGYVAPSDAVALADAYRFFRTVEHRLQLAEDQPVHAVPAGEPARARLARVLGYRDDRGSTALGSFEADLRRHQATGRAIHERLFFRPLLEAFTTPRPATAPALDEEAAAARLTAFGFSDAERTRQAVAELTRGLSRSSRLMRQMLPLIFEWLSEAPDPELGLLGLRALTTGDHRRTQLTAVFRESAASARQLCLMLGAGPAFARTLERNPDLLVTVGAAQNGDAQKRPTEAPTAPRPRATRAASLLGIRTRQTLLIAAEDVAGRATVERTGRALTALAERLLESALDVVEPAVPFAVIAMGRFGGGELSYASDLDVLFVFDGPDEAHRPAITGTVGTPAITGTVGTIGTAEPRSQEPPSPEAAAEAAATALLRLVGGITPSRQLYRLDARLRPEGRQGPLARSVDAYARYYRRWAEPWERQALLRGRFVAGDRAVGERFAAVAEAFVWGAPFDDAAIREVRRIKARIEDEHVPAGEDREFHLKSGPGALTDIEWTVQLLQLVHGVRANGVLDALSALVDAGVVDERDAEVLVASYRFCERARNRLYLVRGSGADSLPAAGHQLGVLARSMGTSPTGLRDQYRRQTRRARRVVERLFWDS